MLPAGLQVDQHRRLLTHGVELVQIDLDTEPAGDCRQMNDAIGGPADREQDAQCVLERLAGEDLVRCQAVLDHLHCGGTGPLRDTDALRGDRGWRCPTRQHDAERLGQARHGARGSHARHQLVVHARDFLGIDLLCPILGPEAAAIGAGTDAFRAVRSREHRAGHQRNGRHAGGSAAHQLSGHRLVAAADEHHGIHRLRTYHLLGVHRHQVAHIHARRLGEALVDRDGREFHRQSACKHDAALHRLDELVGIAMARVIGAARVGDSDHEAVQRIICVPGALDEGPAQEDGKVEIAVVGQPLVHTLWRRHSRLVGLTIAHLGPRLSCYGGSVGELANLREPGAFVDQRQHRWQALARMEDAGALTVRQRAAVMMYA